MCKANEAIMPPLFGEPASIVAYGRPFNVMNVVHHFEVFFNLELKTCKIIAASVLLTAPTMTVAAGCMALRPFRIPNEVASAKGISADVHLRWYPDWNENAVQAYG